jgi:GNAT superfamily N-acetyltransferase
MARRPVELSFEEITKGDIPELTAVMTRAFDDDAQKHLGKERGGPEGYDNGDFFHKWLFPYQESVGYKVVSEGKVIGALIVWILPGDHNILGTMFVDPDHQDRGVGTQMWQFVEQTYPETKSWRLATPVWATKNHHFYEVKCGFHRVHSDPLLGELEAGFIAYRKEMKPAD